jgi:hypothetical protein
VQPGIAAPLLVKSTVPVIGCADTIAVQTTALK